MEPAELLDALQRLHHVRQREMREQWGRSVPFGDEITDRWQRARALGFGEGTSVYDSSVILGDVRIGERTWVGPFTVLDGSGGGLEIGDTCSISAGVQVYTHDSVRWAVSRAKADLERAPVRIGNHTYIGPMTVVTRGVTIGRHCVIGAHSIVNKDVPDYSIAWGSTCRIVGRVVLNADDSVEFLFDAQVSANP